MNTRERILAAGDAGIVIRPAARGGPVDAYDLDRRRPASATRRAQITAGGRPHTTSWRRGGMGSDLERKPPARCLHGGQDDAFRRGSRHEA